MNNFPVFYHPNPSQSVLTEEEASHAIRVLRLKQKDRVNLLDGKGGRYLAEIQNMDKKKVEIKIVETILQENHQDKIRLIVAPTKQMERMEWMVEKCTELGIQTIAFIKTQHSERKEIKLDRLQKIAIAGMKQSKNTFLPILEEMVDLSSWLKNHSNVDHIQVFGNLIEEKNRPLNQLVSKEKPIDIMVGPEGDFSTNEIKSLLTMNWLPIQLGNSILRTETAGIVALSQIKFLLNQ